MEYQIKATGKRVVLHALANADQSMAGLKVSCSQIIPMKYSDFLALVINVMGEREINRFDLSLFKYHTFPVQKEGGKPEDPIMVIETVEDSEHSILETEGILDALKLYQASDIFSCYKFSYCVRDGKLKGGGIGEILLHEHAINWPYQPYQMTEESKELFPAWFETHKIYPGKDQNEKFQHMVQLYMDSYLTGDSDQSFVMLTIVLEMLFGSTAELTYRISRGVGIFLSSDRDEMRCIVRTVKRLYNLRSKYVHEGKRIPSEALFELREIVRKTIVLMYERGMHKPKFDFTTFSDEITYEGYEKESNHG